MHEFTGRVAVVTGAASGIGRSLALHCGQEGMKVVVADMNTQALELVEAELKSNGAPVLAVPTDVSKARDVEELAQRTLEAFGAVHLLFNNAGVVRVNRTWEASLAEWEWVLGVNLWGVIHGIHTFVPIMLAQAEESHIVNTASGAGLIATPGIGVYKVTKHAVVALSEMLYHELAQESKHVKVSVLCPANVNTPLLSNSAQSRPESVPTVASQYDSEVEREAKMVAAFSVATPPDEIAAKVFAALREDKFYIVPHPQIYERVQQRMEDILQGRNPSAPDPFFGRVAKKE